MLVVDVVYNLDVLMLKCIFLFFRLLLDWLIVVCCVIFSVFSCGLFLVLNDIVVIDILI